MLAQSWTCSITKKCPTYVSSLDRMILYTSIEVTMNLTTNLGFNYLQGTEKPTDRGKNEAVQLRNGKQVGVSECENVSERL